MDEQKMESRIKALEHTLRLAMILVVVNMTISFAALAITFVVLLIGD
jgi:hypothetical protein